MKRCVIKRRDDRILRQTLGHRPGEEPALSSIDAGVTFQRFLQSGPPLLGFAAKGIPPAADVMDLVRAQPVRFFGSRRRLYVLKRRQKVPASLEYTTALLQHHRDEHRRQHDQRRAGDLDTQRDGGQHASHRRQHKKQQDDPAKGAPPDEGELQNHECPSKIAVQKAA